MRSVVQFVAQRCLGLDHAVDPGSGLAVLAHVQAGDVHHTTAVRGELSRSVHGDLAAQRGAGTVRRVVDLELRSGQHLGGVVLCMLQQLRSTPVGGHGVRGVALGIVIHVLGRRVLDSAVADGSDGGVEGDLERGASRKAVDVGLVEVHDQGSASSGRRRQNILGSLVEQCPISCSGGHHVHLGAVGHIGQPRVKGVLHLVCGERLAVVERPDGAGRDLPRHGRAETVRGRIGDCLLAATLERVLRVDMDGPQPVGGLGVAGAGGRRVRDAHQEGSCGGHIVRIVGLGHQVEPDRKAGERCGSVGQGDR